MTRLFPFIFVIEYQIHEKQIWLDFQNVSHTCLFFTGTIYHDTIRGVKCSAATWGISNSHWAPMHICSLWLGLLQAWLSF